MKDQLVALLKYLLSFRTSDWRIEDYPVRLRQQAMTSTNVGKWKHPAWVAQIINWWQLTGSGETQDAAIANLDQNLAKYKQRHGKLPRPGRHVQVKLEFAASEIVRKHEALARRFFQAILSMDYDNCIITDRSSLWDFPGTTSLEKVVERIRQVYGVDVSDIESGNLAEIFERLAAQGGSR